MVHLEITDNFVHFNGNFILLQGSDFIFTSLMHIKSSCTVLPYCCTELVIPAELNDVLALMMLVVKALLTTVVFTFYQ